MWQIDTVILLYKITKGELIMGELIDVERVSVGICPKCEGIAFVIYFPDGKEVVTIDDIIDIECANSDCRERLLIDR